MAERHLTAQGVREVLEYDPDTGLFVWLKTMGPRAKAGQVAGYPCTKGYIRIAIKGVKYRAHRLAWLYMTGNWPRDQIDHIDRNTSNNAFNNLRESDRWEQQKNKRQRGGRRSTTGVPGVHRRGEKFRASVYIGTFESVELALQAIDRVRHQINI